MELGTSSGFEKLISFKELRGYIVNDSCAFAVDIISVAPFNQKIENLVLRIANKNTYKWTIPNFSLLSKSSPITTNFTLCDNTWYMRSTTSLNLSNI